MGNFSFAVDVSNNQAAHQPWQTFGAHLGFAKASEGQHGRDAWFDRHITDIKADGLVPGGYHFAWPNQSAAAEAANYIGAVRDHTVPLFVHALDLERYPNGARNYVGATSAQIRQYAHDWIDAVKKAFPGQKVGIYTSGDDILDGHLPGNQDFLWYPAYPVQGRTFAQAAAAARPAPSGHTVWGWQFTSVPRDQSVIYMSPAQLRTWAAGTKTPTVQEDDVDLTAAQITAIGKEAAHQTWIYQWNSPADPKTLKMMGTYVASTDALKAAVTASASAMVKQLAPLIGSGVDTDRVIDALKDLVVKVEIVGATAPTEA